MRSKLLSPDSRSFGARFTENVKRGFVAFFRPKPLWIQVILVIILPTLPLFWVINAIRRKPL